MPLASDLITNVSHQLHGWGSTADRITPLASPIGPTDTTFTVTAAFGQSVGIAPGVVEIESEQLYVQTVDQSTGNCTLASGFGRGYNNTTAVSHAAGAPVVSRPKFPRADIFRNVNVILGAVYPELFVVKTFTSTVTYPSNTYTLPVGRGLSVLDVQWQHPIGDWLSVLSYNVDRYDGSLRLGSLGDAIMVGRPLRVLYTVEPALFTAETDDFSVTGLPLTSSDVIELGVIAKMVVGLDISRAQVSSVESSQRSTVVPPSAGVSVAKWVQAEYKDRLMNEAASLRKIYPPRISRRFSS